MKKAIFISLAFSLSKLFCALFAVFIFGHFSPLVDATHYLSGSYPEDASFRTRLIQVIAVLLSHIGGDIFAHWCFGMFSLIGVFYYLVRGGKNWGVWLPMFLPSAIVWTSIVGKEAIYYGMFTLILVIWVRCIRRKTDLFDYMLLSFAIITCALLRPHYTIGITWMLLAGYLSPRLGRYRWLLFVAFILGTCVFLSSDLWQEIMYRGFTAIEPQARASRFVMLGIDPGTTAGYNTFKSFIPIGVFISVLGPLPVEAYSRPILLPFLLEGFIVLIFSPLSFLYASRNRYKAKKQFKEIFIVCIIPAITFLMLIHSPFGILNPGTASRWRVNFEPVLLIAPMLLFTELSSEVSDAHSSFSS